MSSNYNINGLIEGIKDVCIDKGIDWIITAVITYFSARYATRCYYDKTRVMVAKNTMEQGLRALLKLRCDEKLPDAFFLEIVDSPTKNNVASDTST